QRPERSDGIQQCGNLVRSERAMHLCDEVYSAAGRVQNRGGALGGLANDAVVGPVNPCGAERIVLDRGESFVRRLTSGRGDRFGGVSSNQSVQSDALPIGAAQEIMGGHTE